MIGGPIGWPIGGYIDDDVELVEGILVASEAPDTVAIVGAIITDAILEATEAPDIAAMAGYAAWTGTLAAVEAADGAVMAGFVDTPTVTDWKFPTAHTVISGGGWINPANVYAKDGAICAAQHNELGTDWFLKTQGYEIDRTVIPDDAIIVKVELEVKWNVSPP